MHLNLRLVFLALTCLLNLLFESVSSQLILPREYIRTDHDDSQLFSHPDQGPGHRTTIPEHQREEYLKQVEGQILRMFGLNSRPKPNKNHQVHPYLLDLYSKIQTTNSLDETSEKSRRKKKRGMKERISFTGSHNTIRSHDLKESAHPLPGLFKFEVTLPSEEELKGVELRLPHNFLFNSQLQSNQIVHNNNNDDDSDSSQNSSSIHESSLTKSSRFRKAKSDWRRIEVHELLSNPGKEEKDIDNILSRIIDTQVIDSFSANKWSSFDARPAVERWLRDPSTNFGLLITVSYVNGTQVVHNNFNNLDKSSPGPLIVTYSNDLKGQEKERNLIRNKRGSGPSNNNRKHRRKGRRDFCRRHHLYVDFSDVGWTDWIVAPPGFQAYYCQGECPYPLGDHLNTTNHAIVQTLVNSVSPTMVPRACCIPTELSAISMLYVDESDKVVLKNYQDMVVEGCGCR